MNVFVEGYEILLAHLLMCSGFYCCPIAVLGKNTGVDLSPRERQVLSALSRGLISKEIARELNLSPRTIEDIRSRLLKKFNMRNAAELIAHLTGIAPLLGD